MSGRRLLYLIHSLDYGGAERRCILLANEAVRRGHAARVVTLFAAGAQAERLDPAVEQVHLGARRRDWLGLERAVRRQVGEFGAEVVQAFLATPNRVGLLAARRGGARLVISTLGNTFEHLGRRDRWLDRVCFRYADVALANSQGVLEFYRDQWGYPAHKLALTPSFVPLADFAYRDSATRAEARAELGCGDALLFGTVASLTRQKGHRHLLEAVRLVAPALPGAGWLIIGDGPLRGELETAAAGLPVRFLGARNDVPRLLQAMDLFVLPSLWEGMPNAALEAMATGLPLIATDVAGSRELALPGRTGWLVPPADAPALAEAMREAAEPARRADYGRAARALVEANHDQAVQLPRFFALYEQWLAAIA